MNVVGMLKVRCLVWSNSMVIYNHVCILRCHLVYILNRLHGHTKLNGSQWCFKPKQSYTTSHPSNICQAFPWKSMPLKASAMQIRYVKQDSAVIFALLLLLRNIFYGYSTHSEPFCFLSGTLWTVGNVFTQLHHLLLAVIQLCPNIRPKRRSKLIFPFKKI